MRREARTNGEKKGLFRIFEKKKRNAAPAGSEEDRERGCGERRGILTSKSYERRRNLRGGKKKSTYPIPADMTRREV